MTKRLALFFVPIAALLFVFRDVIFFGKFFFSGDVLLSNLPFLFYRGLGGFPIMQEILSGYPLFVSVNASWFYPISTFLFSHLEATTAYILLSMANMLLVYPFAYLYARKIKLSNPASIVAATMFTFSGQIMLWAPSIIATAFYFLLPASLYLFELSLEKKLAIRLSILTLLGVMLGTGWIASQVQYVLYIHAFFFVYVVARLLLLEKKKNLLSLAASLGVPIGASFLVGLPMISTLLAFQHETLRASGVALSEYVATGYLPTNLIHFFLPFWSVNFVPLGSVNLYMGILSFLFVLIAFFAIKKINNTYALFFAGTFIFCFVASIYYSPVAIVMHYLPFWSAFRETARIMYIGAFAGAMLAGMGFDYILARWGEFDFYRTKLVQFFVKAFFFVALPVFVVFTGVRMFFFEAIKSRLYEYFLVHIYPQTTGLPKEHYLAVLDSYLHQALDQLSFYDPQVIIFVMFASASIWIFSRGSKISRDQFAILSVVIVTLNFACVYGWYYETVDLKAMHTTPHTVLAVRALEKDSSVPYRLTSIFPAMTVYTNMVACPISPEEKIELQNELLQPNAGVFYGLDVPEGYDNFMSKYISESLGYIGSESTGSANPLFLERIPLEEKLQIILARANVLRAMNIKYVVSGVPLSYSGLTLLESWRTTHCNTPIYLYRLGGTWPRYFATNEMGVATSSLNPTDVLGELNTHETPYVLFNEELDLQKKKGAPFVLEAIPVYSKQGISFERVSCANECAFLIGNAYLSGWSATVDGAPAKVHRANYLYMALTLSPGEHQIVLRYK